MKFTPMTDEEMQTSQLIPAKEICEFQVLQAVNHVSPNSGNEMIKLTLKVFYKNYSMLIFDYLMTHAFIDGEKVPSAKMQFKLKHACKSMGILDKFNSGELDAKDFLDKFGVVKIGIQEDKTGQWPSRNTVSDYLDSEPGKLNHPTPEKANSEWSEDDVPF